MFGCIILTLLADRADSGRSCAGVLTPNVLLPRTHPTSAVLPDAGYFANRVTLSLAGDAGRGVGRIGAAAALVAG